MVSRVPKTSRQGLRVSRAGKYHGLQSIGWCTF
uniref:Uncharacterized protein n=1 Tax=Arundo donax TaxID=35708 RepID=A0A0A9T9G1_ARUDO